MAISKDEASAFIFGVGMGGLSMLALWAAVTTQHPLVWALTAALNAALVLFTWGVLSA